MIEDSKMNPNARLLIQKYREQSGKNILLKDYHNTKYKLTSKNHEVAENIIKIAKRFTAKEGNIIEIAKDPKSNTIKTLFIQSKQGGLLYEKLPKILQLDGTYCTNISNYSLYLLVCPDYTFKTQIIAASLIRNEDSVNIGEFLSIFKSRNPAHTQLETIVIDKDSAEINAIKHELPEAKIILCYFHNLANIEKNLKEPFAKAEQMKNIFRAMSKTTDQVKFTSLSEDMKSLSNEKFWKYFDENWLNCQEYWAGYSVNFNKCYGNNSNGRIEGKNRALKLILDRHDKLDVFLEKYILFLDQDEIECKHRLFSQTMSISTKLDESDILEYIQSKYCHELYVKCSNESKKLSLSFEKNPEGKFIFDDDMDVKQIFDPKEQICDCHFFKHFGLPCRHIFQLVTKKLISFDNFDGTYQLNSIKAVESKRRKSMTIATS